jgi:hypothetical protein
MDLTASRKLTKACSGCAISKFLMFKFEGDVSHITAFGCAAIPAINFGAVFPRFISTVIKFINASFRPRQILLLKFVGIDFGSRQHNPITQDHSKRCLLLLAPVGSTGVAGTANKVRLLR